MSQKRHPIWFPHCPTCTVTNSRGILCRPPRNSTRRGWTWTSMRSLHFKCRSFHKPAALRWTIPPLPFFSFSLPFSSSLATGFDGHAGAGALQIITNMHICDDLYAAPCALRCWKPRQLAMPCAACSFFPRVVRFAYLQKFVLLCRAHPCCQKHMVVAHLGSKHINQRRLTNGIL
jgi:hypothetical protein